MRGRLVWLAVGLLLAAGFTGYFAFAYANSADSKPAVDVQSFQIVKGGPLGTLLYASLAQHSAAVAPGSSFVLNMTLAFYSAGDDGMPLTNSTSADVSMSLGTPGFSLIRLSYPQFQDNLTKVTILANSISNVLVTIRAPSSAYTGPLSFSLTATSGSG